MGMLHLRNMKPAMVSFLNSAHVTSQGNRTHFEETRSVLSHIHMLTKAPDWLVLLTMIDGGERNAVSLPGSRATFAVAS